MAVATSLAGISGGNVVSGSRVRLQVGGQVIGYATIASYTESIGYEPIVVLDQLEVAEFAPVSYDVAFTASRVYIITHELKGRLDIMAKWPDGQGSDALLFNLLTKGEMTGEIIDRIGENPVAGNPPTEKTIARFPFASGKKPIPSTHFFTRFGILSKRYPTSLWDP
ncbi:MAG: hypothetical protein G01um101470_315 [Parcubacteria group bacterium Gr01-1014_70]|nr:MAG: hypothetical protein G01um101470_315 [Parcubacteria group bacterium Gr01-1014_70]